jgi:hypothetical protein
MPAVVALGAGNVVRNSAGSILTLRLAIRRLLQKRIMQRVAPLSSALVRKSTVVEGIIVIVRSDGDNCDLPPTKIALTTANNHIQHVSRIIYWSDVFRKINHPSQYYKEE